MKTEKNMRKGFGLAGKIAMFCIGLVSLVLTSCESELEIQQSYPFTVETMPVPKELNRNETAEIRCELKSEGDSILRKDLKEMCALFRHLGKDSLLVACLAYQVGPYKLLGYGRMPKSTLIRKLEAGNRDIYVDFIQYCHYKGKKIPSIERRRKEEYNQLYIR